MPLYKALTIAGSDSGAGAGIQADLKTFAALEIYGTSAVTAVTAQNTQKVTTLECLSPQLVVNQIDAVLSDIGADAIKTGMLGNCQIIHVVAGHLTQYPQIPLVVDPVMASHNGELLMEEEVIESLRDQLLPLAQVFTPNVPEAEALVGRKLEGEPDYLAATREIASMGPKVVVLKGGHRLELTADKGNPREVVDLFFDGQDFQNIRGPRLQGAPKHGTGCTFSAAITAGLAKGWTELTAVQAAKEYLNQAWRHSFKVGPGDKPLNHFHATWPSFSS